MRSPRNTSAHLLLPALLLLSAAQIVCGVCLIGSCMNDAYAAPVETAEASHCEMMMQEAQNQETQHQETQQKRAPESESCHEELLNCDAEPLATSQDSCFADSPQIGALAIASIGSGDAVVAGRFDLKPPDPSPPPKPLYTLHAALLL